MPNLRLRLLVVTASAVVCFRNVSGQGSLTPPAPPGPAMKSLDQIDQHISLADQHVAQAGEKRIDVLSLPAGNTSQHVISAAGSYYLSGNVKGVSGKNGIAITVGNVTLDLNGFQLLGVAGSGSGISDGGKQSGQLVIRNGAVTSWGGAGISFKTSYDSLVSDIVASNNGKEGIATGSGSVVRNCTSRSNVGNNISGANGCAVVHCVAFGSTSGFGIQVASNSTVTDCAAPTNVAGGISASLFCKVSGCSSAQSPEGAGITVGSGSVIDNCSATSNQGGGIVGADGCQVSHSTATVNGNKGKPGAGIDIGRNAVISDCTVANNTSDNNGEAINAGVGATITNCSVSSNLVTYAILAAANSTISHCNVSQNNSAQVFSTGINTDFSTIEDCTASQNINHNGINTTSSGVGIFGFGNCSVINCNASGNAGCGITVGSDCLVKSCVATGNFPAGSSAASSAGAGIYATGTRNRIEGNLANNNNIGFLATNDDINPCINLIIANSARENAINYFINAGNRVGLIVTPATNASGISGDTGGTTFTTSGHGDAWSNIAY